MSVQENVCDGGCVAIMLNKLLFVLRHEMGRKLVTWYTVWSASTATHHTTHCSPKIHPVCEHRTIEARKQIVRICFCKNKLFWNDYLCILTPHWSILLLSLLNEGKVTSWSNGGRREKAIVYEELLNFKSNDHVGIGWDCVVGLDRGFVWHEDLHHPAEHLTDCLSECIPQGVEEHSERPKGNWVLLDSTHWSHA